MNPALGLAKYRLALAGLSCVLVSVVVAAVTFPGSAAAGSKVGRQAVAPAVELFTAQVAAGGSAEVFIDARNNRYCALTLSNSSAGHSSSLVRVRRRHVQWRWKTSAKAAPGPWRARVTCAHKRQEVSSRSAGRALNTLIVQGRRRAHGRLISARSLRVTFTRSSPRGRPAASGGRAEAGLGAGRNPFDPGQCTFHAYETRSDVYDTAVAHGVPRGGSVAGGGYAWDAWRWLGNAQRAGIPTGSTPVVGAIVVFPRGYGGSSVGHVAYVEGVNPDGTYVVSERNWNYNHNVTRRLVYPGSPGVAFIYGGAAGTGTQAPVTPSPPPAPGPSPGQAITYAHHVYGTCNDGHCGLNERAGPGYSSYAVTGSKHDGDQVAILCQTRGELVTPNHGTASTVWDHLGDGQWITDVYVDTSGTAGALSPPIPQC